MSRHGKVKRNRFGKFYAGYLLLIAALMLVLFLNVRGTLVKYEKSQPENYVISLLEHAGKNDKALGSYLQDNFFGDNAKYAYGDAAERSREFYNTVAHSKLEAKKDLANSEGSKLIYNITADEKPFVTVAMTEKSIKKKMLGLLSIAEYNLDFAFLRDPDSTKKNLKISENGTLEYTLVLPEDFSVCVDGKPIALGDNTEPAVIDDFESISQYPMVPDGVRVSLEFPFEPNLSVQNSSGKEVAMNLFGGVYYAAADYSGSAEAPAVFSEIGDPIEMYKLWIRFTRMADVPGSYYGLYTVKDGCRFLPGSDMDTFAENWAHQVDITFVSDYDDYSFTKKEAGNYVVYNDKFCSCDVHIDETIWVTGVGERTDSYNNRMFFIYNEDTGIAPKGWYWVGQLDLTGR